MALARFVSEARREGWRRRGWTRDGWSSERLTACAIAALALTARVLYWLDAEDYPAFWAPIVDADRYDALARKLAAGFDPGLELHWQGAFYPGFLSLIYRAAPSAMAASLGAAKVAQALLGTATALVTWQLAAELCGKRWSWIAGVILALYAPALFYESELLGTGWEMFWAVGLPLLFIRARPGQWPVHALLGIALGLSVLTRATFLPFALGASVWLGWRRRLAREARKDVPALLLGLALALTPALWHRQRSGGDLSLLPLSAGVNLYVGNNAERCRTLAARPGSEWQSIVDSAEHAGAGSDATAQNLHFRQRFYTYLSADMPGFLRGLMDKALQLVAGRELPRNDDLYTARRWSSWLSAQVHEAGIPFALLVAFGGLGAWRLRRALSFPFVWMLVTQAGSLLLVFVASRHRMALVPLLGVLSVAGLQWLSERGSTRAYGFVALAALLGLSMLPRDPCGASRLSEADLFLAVGHRYLGLEQLPEAAQTFERGLELAPQSAELSLAAFFAHMKQRKPAAALPHITRYAQLRPADANAARMLEGTRAMIGHEPAN